MAGTIAPFVFWQCLDSNGDPISGGQVFTYESGTSTKKTTYSDGDLTVANTNPIVLDAAGRATIYLGAGSYKFVLAPADDTDPPASPIETRDPVTAVPTSQSTVDVTGTAGETLAANQVCYLSVGEGSKTAGRWYKADATYAYASSLAGAMAFATEAAIAGASTTLRGLGRMTGFSTLSEGYVQYVDTTPGAITPTPPTNARPVAVADTASSVVILAPVPVVFGQPPRRDIGEGDIVAHIPVILQHGYSGGSTTTPNLTIPGGTLGTDGDSLVFEWQTDYSSATLSARVTFASTNKDFGSGSGSTVTYGRLVATRTSTTAMDLSFHGQQSADAVTAHDTVAVLDLSTTDLTVNMAMASGTYTIRSYTVWLVPKL